MMGSAICVNCSVISSDCLSLTKQTTRGPRYSLCFPRHYWLTASDSTTGFDRTKDILGERVTGQTIAIIISIYTGLLSLV